MIIYVKIEYFYILYVIFDDDENVKVTEKLCIYNNNYIYHIQASINLFLFNLQLSKHLSPERVTIVDSATSAKSRTIVTAAHSFLSTERAEKRKEKR